MFTLIDKFFAIIDVLAIGLVVIMFADPYGFLGFILRMSYSQGGYVSW